MAGSGDNLYSCSVIALDADTGKLKWHYQFSPHNEFDWDSTTGSRAGRYSVEGQPAQGNALGQPQRHVLCLDRTNGEFLFGKPFVKTNWWARVSTKGPADMLRARSRPQTGVLIYPGNQGATNWYNPSFSPRTGLFYIPTWENSSTTYIKDQEPPEFHSGQTFSGKFPQGRRERRRRLQRRPGYRSADGREEVGLPVGRSFN